jgi:hypothetical protein
LSNRYYYDKGYLLLRQKLLFDDLFGRCNT